MYTLHINMHFYAHTYLTRILYIIHIYMYIEHLLLFGPEIQQYQLQNSFYTLYEPELIALQSLSTILYNNYHTLSLTRILFIPTKNITQYISYTILNSFPLTPTLLQSYSIYTRYKLYKFLQKSTRLNRLRTKNISGFGQIIKLNHIMFLKYSNNYLLDVLDIHTKVRCVFSWLG